MFRRRKWKPGPLRGITRIDRFVGRGLRISEESAPVGETGGRLLFLRQVMIIEQKKYLHSSPPNDTIKKTHGCENNRILGSLCARLRGNEEFRPMNLIRIMPA